MSLLSAQVSALVKIRQPSAGAAVMNKLGVANRAAIMAVIAKYGPIGEIEISKLTMIGRTCCHNHLMALSRERLITRDKPRDPWIVANKTAARIVTFTTNEDDEE